VTWYEISALGIDKIEGGSEFEPKDRYEGINITATGTNVVTLGDGNVANGLHRVCMERNFGLLGDAANLRNRLHGAKLKCFELWRISGRAIPGTMQAISCRVAFCAV